MADQTQSPRPVRILVQGKTGVGVSSLVNSLLGVKASFSTATGHRCTSVVYEFQHARSSQPTDFAATIHLSTDAQLDNKIAGLCADIYNQKSQSTVQLLFAHCASDQFSSAFAVTKYFNTCATAGTPLVDVQRTFQNINRLESAKCRQRNGLPKHGPIHLNPTNIKDLTAGKIFPYVAGRSDQRLSDRIPVSSLVEKVEVFCKHIKQDGVVYIDAPTDVLSSDQMRGLEDGSDIVVHVTGIYPSMADTKNLFRTKATKSTLVAVTNIDRLAPSYIHDGVTAPGSNHTLREHMAIRTQAIRLRCEELHKGDILSFVAEEGVKVMFTSPKQYIDWGEWDNEWDRVFITADDTGIPGLIDELKGLVERLET